MKIGFIAAGDMAARLADTVRQMDDMECYAVAARDETRAAAFAETYGCGKSYGGYDALLEDGGVELAYISTVHPEHFAVAKRAIEKGIPVLLEKPFTLNARETGELLKLAKEKKTFIMEAMWMRFLPIFASIRKAIDGGMIGEPRMLTANFMFSDSRRRIFDPALGGGMLLDVGVYLLNLALFVFPGETANITSSAVLGAEGTDEQESIAVCFKGGQIASLAASSRAVCENGALICGSDGCISVSGLPNPAFAAVFDKSGSEVDRFIRPPQISGYEYQLRAAAAAIADGRTECEGMPHSLTVRVMEMMDGIRSDWGLKYPGESEDGLSGGGKGDKEG